MKIAYYVTAHGYGHGVRTADLLTGLYEACPTVDLVLVTNLPDAFWSNRLAGRRWGRVPGRFDVGMVQLDSVRVDVPATREKVRELLRERPRLVAEQATWLQAEGVDLVVSDVAAIPLEAASQAGIPGIAVANFTWSWIYGEFGWTDEIAEFDAGYQQASLCIETPFAGGLAIFPRRETVGLLARPGRAQRDKVVALTGADPTKPWVLLSFSTLDWDEAALTQVRALVDYQFFTIEPLSWKGGNLYTLQRADLAVPDIFASVDLVLTKPGFGATSECIVNRRPMIWVDRTGFRETPVLVAEIRRLLQQVEILEADLYAGHLGPSLMAIGEASWPNARLPVDGAAKAARLILGCQQ